MNWAFPIRLSCESARERARAEAGWGILSQDGLYGQCTSGAGSNGSTPWFCNFLTVAKAAAALVACSGDGLGTLFLQVHLESFL